ncbi:helix-turn-helix domain-containing protein [Luteimonas qiangzhengi]|uniref:helix-turn-helix domain-containing protein n=1 Tax=Luteimonas sp. MJ146 TaxID=3129240 RepID=UPI0031BB88E1
MDEASELRQLGAAMRVFRSGLGLSQELFADKIGMHRAYYGAIERGAQNITVSTLTKICSGLGVSASEVLGEAGL